MKTRFCVRFSMFRYPLWIAASATLFFGGELRSGLAQMPGNEFSPWNQLGRAWGIGIGDGYHECPNCPTDRSHGGRSKGYEINAFRTSGQKGSLSMSPVSTKSFLGQDRLIQNRLCTACGGVGCRSCMSLGAAYTVLPPTSPSYQHQVAPSERALPWAPSMQQSYAPSTLPTTNQPATQSQLPMLTPTPATRPSSNSQVTPTEPAEPNRMPKTNPLPDANSDRKPSQSDQDLSGNDYLLDSEDPATDKSNQPANPKPDSPKDDSDSLIPENGESFDLVPGQDLPPVTQRGHRATKPSSMQLPPSIAHSWNDRIQRGGRIAERQYYDDGYSIRQSNGGGSAPYFYQADRSSMNRYR